MSIFINIFVPKNYEIYYHLCLTLFPSNNLYLKLQLLAIGIGHSFLYSRISMDSGTKKIEL